MLQLPNLGLLSLASLLTLLSLFPLLYSLSSVPFLSSLSLLYPPLSVPGSVSLNPVSVSLSPLHAPYLASALLDGHVFNAYPSQQTHNSLSGEGLCCASLDVPVPTATVECLNFGDE